MFIYVLLRDMRLIIIMSTNNTYSDVLKVANVKLTDSFEINYLVEFLKSYIINARQVCAQGL